jgi:hypothetical protein
MIREPQAQHWENLRSQEAATTWSENLSFEDHIKGSKPEMA